MAQIYTCVGMYVCTSIYIYIYIFIYLFVYLFICVYIYTHIHASMCVCKYIYICPYRISYWFKYRFTSAFYLRISATVSVAHGFASIHMHRLHDYCYENLFTVVCIQESLGFKTKAVIIVKHAGGTALPLIDAGLRTAMRFGMPPF